MVHGFESQDALESWTRRIEEAARVSLIPEAVLVRNMRDALQRVFMRTLKPTQLLKRHKGLQLYTLNSIQPKLHAELNRRIMASANLIKLNRTSSIQRTLQRFSGWATSVPAGGGTQSRKEVRETVRRGIAGLPFEERRVIVDQGHKLVAAVNELVAVEGGAIAAIWRHVKEGGGYQARPIHEARDGDLYWVRGNWVIAKGLAKRGGLEYTDEVEQPGELVFCRCWWQFFYNLRELPRELLTDEGREQLKQARAAITRYQHAV